MAVGQTLRAAPVLLVTYGTHWGSFHAARTLTACQPARLCEVRGLTLTKGWHM